MKKISILLLLLTSIGATTYAQTIARNSSFQLNTRNVLVRNNDDATLFVFDYHNDNCINPGTNINVSSRTTIYYTDTAMNMLKKVCDLPCGYRVYDAQFVTLHRNDAALTPVRFCVFCGTITEDTGYYSAIQWISEIKYTGFVGLFYIDTIFQTTAPGSVYVRNVEGCRELFKLVAYTEKGGWYQNTCQNIFKENAVLDIVGLPRYSIPRASVVARVKFYPECNGEIRWDNNIRTPPAGSTETVVDIIKEDTMIVTASVFTGDNHTVWLRYNRQEDTLFRGGREFTDDVYTLDMYYLSRNGHLPSDIYSSSFSLPIRLSPLGSGSSVISFNAQNQNSASYTFNGLFSLRLDIKNSTILDGICIDNAGTLTDVAGMVDTFATILLTQNGLFSSRMDVAKWNNITHPLYTTIFSNTIHSVYRYKSGTNNGFWGMASSGSYMSSPNFYIRIGYRKYFNSSTPSTSCMTSSVNTAIDASNIIPHLKGELFRIYKRYEHKPTVFPVTAIPIVNTSITNISICNN